MCILIYAKLANFVWEVPEGSSIVNHEYVLQLRFLRLINMNLNFNTNGWNCVEVPERVLRESQFPTMDRECNWRYVCKILCFPLIEELLFSF